MIALATNSTDPSLELHRIRRFRDGSGFSCEVFVRCHGFSAQRRFYFSERSFRTALEGLRHMNERLEGEARLEEDFNRTQFLQLRMRAHGHVAVSGQLVLLDGGPNCLSFEFETDQTCLAPLIRSFEKLDHLDINT